MAPSGSGPLELNAFQIQLCSHLSVLLAPHSPPRQSPTTAGLEGCGDPAGGGQEGLARRPVLCHQTTREVAVEKSRIGDSGRGCVWGSVSTQASPVRGTDVKMLVQVPSVNVTGNYTTSQSVLMSAPVWESRLRRLLV